MKEFDIEKAKAGAPVCTRDGKPVRIICFDYQEYGQQDADEKFPIIALVKYDGGERAFIYRESGKCILSKDYEDELMMASVKREGWVLVDKGNCIAHIYDTKEEAEKDGEDIIYDSVAHIEWEE